MTLVARTLPDGTKLDKDGRELVSVCGDSGIYMHKDVVDRIEREWEEWHEKHGSSDHVLDDIHLNF